jgi:DNA-binding transcriptional LysR family regulator
MNIEHCREFIELAQCLNFTDAANRLNITQPALSKHILALEKDLHTDLFDRSRSGVRLSEGGRLFFESAALIVSTYDRTRETLERLQKTRSIRVGGHLDDSDIASQLSMVTMLAREHYHISVIFNRTTKKEPLELLSDSEADLCIAYLTRERIETAGLCYRPFLSLPLVAIMNTDNPLARRKKLQWRNLHNETFLKFVSGKTNESFEEIEEVCERHGFSPKIRPVPSINDAEFFTTPLQGSILVWKRTQREIGFLLETGHRAAVPIAGSDSYLNAFMIYRQEDEEGLKDFFSAVDEATTLIDRKRDRKAEKNR